MPSFSARKNASPVVFGLEGRPSVAGSGISKARS
jgi:hypothetical protein